MDRPPRPPREPILTLRLLASILWRSLLIAVAAMTAFAWSRFGAGADPAGSTVAFAALSLALLFHIFNLRAERSIFLGEFPPTNRYLWLVVAATLVLQLAGVYLAPLQRVLQTHPLSLLDWAMVVGCSVASLLLVEAAKLWNGGRIGSQSPTEMASEE